MTTITTIAQRLLDENNMIVMDAADTTVTTIAQKVLDQNGYTISDISLVNTEYLLDLAINHVNLMADTDIAALSGVEGAESLVGTKAENYAVQLIGALMIRAYKDRGPIVGLSGLSVSTTINDPQYTQYKSYIDLALDKIRRQIKILDAEYIVKNAVDYVNLHAETSIAFVPSDGAQSLTATDNQIIVVKMVAQKMLANYSARKPLFNLPKDIKLSVEKLRASSQDIPIYVSNDPVST
jgi:hypothetical protein